MAVVDDIFATYRGPKTVARRILAGDRHEGRALTYLVIALLVLFVAQWPALSRDAYFAPELPLAHRMMATFLAVLATIPLFYGLAALGHHAARVLGGRGSYFDARIVLFWALLAITPLMLLKGLVAAFIGPGPALSALGAIVGAMFVWFWASGLAVAGREDGA